MREQLRHFTTIQATGEFRGSETLSSDPILRCEPAVHSGSITFADGVTVEMRVERVEEASVFAYTWRLPNLPEEDPRRTYVEFTLESAGDGTLLRVTESGFAQLPTGIRRQTYESHREGWSREVAELLEHLNGA